MSINRFIKLFVASKQYFGMTVLLILSLTCLYSCDADSSGMMGESRAAAYAKKTNTRYNVHQKITSANQWFVDDTQITVSSGNFWDRLRGSFQLSHQNDNPKVRAQIKWFIHHQAYLERSVKRASPYMYYIFEQVQKRNLPGELLLLPFIESAFNPFAYSGPGAAGLWQFMSGTGADYGLKQNWWYDGRRDVRTSTNAALDYLTYLQSFFDGDWLLAIAAYNTGPGNVQHAVRRNARAGLNTDFFSLGLAQETQAYVPQLLALAAIISDPEEYDIKLPPVRDEPYLAEVNIGYQIDLAEAAQLACISLDEIHRLNPAYTHKLTGPRSPCCLLLPINHVETFKKNLLKFSVINQTSLQRYKVKRHETVESIAARFQVSSYKLRRINHLKANVLRPGRSIFVPVESPRITGNNAKENDAPKDSRDMQEERSSITENSETTQKFEEKQVSGVGKNRIHVSKKTQVKSGKVVVIRRSIQPHEHADLILKQKGSHHPLSLAHPLRKQPAKQPKKPRVVRISYKVRSGESLPHIAKKCHVSVTEIRRWNHISGQSARSGQVLTIYLR